MKVRLAHSLHCAPSNTRAPRHTYCPLTQICDLGEIWCLYLVTWPERARNCMRHWKKYSCIFSKLVSLILGFTDISGKFPLCVEWGFQVKWRWNGLKRKRLPTQTTTFLLWSTQLSDDWKPFNTSELGLWETWFCDMILSLTSSWVVLLYWVYYFIFEHIFLQKDVKVSIIKPFAALSSPLEVVSYTTGVFTCWVRAVLHCKMCTV